MADWIRTAKVGDKVQCIDDGAGGEKHWDKGEEIFCGQVYTIGGIFIDDEDCICLELIEVKRTELARIVWGGRRLGYLYSRFRPVEPRKTDITVFTDMLRTVPVEEVA